MNGILAKKSVVSILRCGKNPDELEIDKMIRKAIRLAGGVEDIIFPGSSVLIKPNVVVAKPSETGATTDPRVVKSIAKLIKEVKAYPIIGESSAVGVNTEDAFKATGYTKLREEGYRVINLKKTEMIKIKITKGLVLRNYKLAIPKIVYDCDAIISVPVMKTHDQSPITLSLKNMKGAIADHEKRKLHTTFGVFQGIADINTLLKPDFTVVDGIIGQEGMGPIYGSPVEMDLIIAGRDPVAVDAVTSQIMGFSPKEIEYLKYAEAMKLGTADMGRITIVGEKISDVKRKFKSFAEALSEQIKIEAFDLIFNEGTCSGCKNTVHSVMLDLKTTGKLDCLRNKTTIVGEPKNIPNIEREKLILIGKCTAKFKDKGIFVTGCPPNNRDIVGAIISEKVEKARYASFSSNKE